MKIQNKRIGIVLVVFAVLILCVSNASAILSFNIGNTSDPSFTAANPFLARIGICPIGYVVQNTTTSGVECVAMSVITSIFSLENVSSSIPDTDGQILVWENNNGYYNPISHNINDYARLDGSTFSGPIRALGDLDVGSTGFNIFNNDFTNKLTFVLANNYTNAGASLVLDVPEGQGYILNITGDTSVEGVNTGDQDLSGYATTSDLSAYVPYTGASSNIDINLKNISSITQTTYTNSSYGIWSNSTDFIIGYIEGLS